MLNFESEIVLQNDRVLLRPLVSSDFEPLVHFSIQEPTLWKYSLTSASGEENMKKYIDLALQKRSQKDSYPFLVIDKKDNTIAGSSRFYDYQKTHNTVQLGYTWYGAKYWGTGLNKNCKFLLLSYAFDTLKLDRVEFRADNNNQRSIAAMKSIGCTAEGVLRSNCSAGQNKRRDSIILSILKSEWNLSIKSNLRKKLK